MCWYAVKKLLTHPWRLNSVVQTSFVLVDLSHCQSIERWLMAAQKADMWSYIELGRTLLLNTFIDGYYVVRRNVTECWLSLSCMMLLHYVVYNTMRCCNFSARLVGRSSYCKRVRCLSECFSWTFCLAWHWALIIKKSHQMAAHSAL